MEPFERKLAKLGDLGNQASELKAQLKTMMSHNEEKFAKLEVIVPYWGSECAILLAYMSSSFA